MDLWNTNYVNINVNVRNSLNYVNSLYVSYHAAYTFKVFKIYVPSPFHRTTTRLKLANMWRQSHLLFTYRTQCNQPRNISCIHSFALFFSRRTLKGPSLSSKSVLLIILCHHASKYWCYDFSNVICCELYRVFPEQNIMNCFHLPPSPFFFIFSFILLLSLQGLATFNLDSNMCSQSQSSTSQSPIMEIMCSVNTYRYIL
jgi:hypothetical protein